MPPPGQSQRAASKFIVFEQFEKMNTQSIRQALSEKEMAWLENLQPIAPNNFVTVPGPAASTVSISETISRQFFGYINGVDYIISITTVGSAWATNIATGITTRIIPPGTFTAHPDMTVWQSQIALFNDTTSGYSAWNGTVFVRQGGVSPNLILTNPGTNYTSAPAVAITGGSGTGATAVATVGTPAVVAINVINHGSGYGPAPGVVFAGGGGAGAAATANIDPRSVISLNLTFGGAYANNAPFPNIGFSGGGGGGAAAVVTAMYFDFSAHVFRVQTIALTSAGSNYSSPPTMAFTGGVPVGGNPANQATATCTVGDGRVLSITVTAGGSGYTSAPSISFSGGGGGAGASAASVIGGSGVTSLTLTNPGSGYLASDVLAVGFAGGGGAGAAASAHVWPFVAGGTTLAIFQGRVWLGSGLNMTFTGTQGYDDFNPANSAGAVVFRDDDLVHYITALRNLNNYLFILGDMSVKQIGNVSVSGSVALFTVVTLSSDQGTLYPMSCASFNRVFMFLNNNGIYAVFGSSVQKISDDLDGIFKLIDFSQQPQAALVDINGIHHVGFLVRYQDPLSTTRSIILVFNGKKWFVVSQGDGLVSIVETPQLNTGFTKTFGSSGADITQLVGNATTAVNFKMQTALTHHGNAVQRKKILAGGIAASLGTGPGSVSVTFDTENGTVAKTYTLPTGFSTPGGAAGSEGSGKYLGMTITGTLAGFTFTNCAVEYQETSVWT